MSVHRGPRIVTDGLVSLIDSGNHRSFPPSGTSLADLVSRSVGSLINVTTSNNDMNYNGSTSEVDFGAISGAQVDNFAGTGTVTAWIRAESAGELNAGRVYDNGSSAGGTSMFTIDPSGSTCKIGFLAITNSTDGQWRTTTQELTFDQWHYIVITYDSDSLSTPPVMYVDTVSKAVSVQTSPAGDYTSNSGLSLIVGNREDGVVCFDGDINYLSFYNRALSTEEIRQNFNALRGRFGV